MIMDTDEDFDEEQLRNITLEADKKLLLENRKLKDELLLIKHQLSQINAQKDKKRTQESTQESDVGQENKGIKGTRAGRARAQWYKNRGTRTRNYRGRGGNVINIQL